MWNLYKSQVTFFLKRMTNVLKQVSKSGEGRTITSVCQIHSLEVFRIEAYVWHLLSVSLAHKMLHIRLQFGRVEFKNETLDYFSHFLAHVYFPPASSGIYCTSSLLTVYLTFQPNS